MTNATHLLFVIALLATPTTSQALELKLQHTPPPVLDHQQPVTIEVSSPQAKEIRLLTATASGGIKTIPLTESLGLFHAQVRADEVAGKTYQFQVRLADNRVLESSPYTIPDSTASDVDELLSNRKTLGALQRKIVQQRRELAQVTDQLEVLTPGYQDPKNLRRAAQALVAGGANEP